MTQDRSEHNREGQGQSERTNQDRSGSGSYEGFEGMNYEQRRQPYRQKPREKPNSDRDHKGSEKP